MPDENDRTAIARMKFGLYHGNRERVYRVWQDYTAFLTNYEEKIKKIILRQAEIANHAMTEEETERMLETSNTAIFTGNVSIWDGMFFLQDFIINS